MKCWRCGMPIAKLGMQVILFGKPDITGCAHEWTFGEDDRYPDLAYYRELVSEFGEPSTGDSNAND